MTWQTVTLELPETLYRFARQMAEATQTPLEVVLRDSIAHTLPPLDDVAPGEATELARLASLDDSALWREARAMMDATKWAEMDKQKKKNWGCVLFDAPFLGDLHKQEDYECHNYESYQCYQEVSYAK